jgi:hypothetical protein
MKQFSSVTRPTSKLMGIEEKGCQMGMKTESKEGLSTLIVLSLDPLKTRLSWEAARAYTQFWCPERVALHWR